MLNVEKLMSLTEMANGHLDGLSERNNVYSNISLDEAVMVGQIQMLESTIEYHNIMDEDANTNMDIFVDQIQGNIMIEAANDAKRSGFVAWITKIKNWIVDKFNKFIQWVKGLASKIKGLFTKKTTQVKTASAKLEEAQKKVEAASKKSPEVAKAVKEVEKDEKDNITFKMSYVDGYAIKSIDALRNTISDVDMSDLAMINDENIDKLVDAISREAEKYKDPEEIDAFIKGLESQSDTKDLDDALSKTFDVYINAYNYKSKPSDIKSFVKDLSDKRTQKELKLSEIGFNPLTDSVEKKFAEIISRLSGAKCEINFTETNRIQNLINGLNTVTNEAESIKKKVFDLFNKTERSISSNTNIDDKILAALRNSINTMSNVVSNMLGFVNKFTGVSAQILNGYYDSCISLTAACISKLGKAVNKVKDSSKDSTNGKYTTNINYDTKSANQSTRDAELDYIPESYTFGVF